MSYILDALKRSEQDRHQVQSATFSPDLLLVNTKTNKSKLWPYLLIVVLLINVAVYGYFQWASSNKIDTQQVVLDNQASQVSGTPKYKSLPAHLRVKPVLEKTPIISSTQNSKDVYVDGGLLIRPKSKSVETSIKKSVSEPASLENRPEGSSNMHTQEKYQVAIKPLHKESQLQEKVKIKSTPDPLLNIPNLSDLSISFQRSIPTITFNSHIYSDKPDASRVMINNLYLREGDAFSSMDLVTIGEFYIVLKKDGQTFKLPVLRDWRAP